VLEIERKFIVDCSAIGGYLNGSVAVLQIQWYIQSNPEVRIRATISRTGEMSWTVTEKEGSGMIRQERERQVDHDECLPSFTVLSDERCVVKIRYITGESARHQAVIDQYLFPDIGCVAEIEVYAEDDLGLLNPLSVWNIKGHQMVEVTERDGFTASNLAQKVNPSSGDHILEEVRTRLGNKACEQLSKLLKRIYSL